MILTTVLLPPIEGAAAEQPRLAAPAATMLASAPASKPAEQDNWRVTVATLNVYFDNQSPEPAVAAIRESKADIVFLQETTRKNEQRLRKELKDSYPHMFFKGGSGRIPTDRFGILSRNPVEKPGVVAPKHGLFGTVIAETVIGDRRLQLANVHLKPLLPPSNARPARYLQAFKALDKAHEAELEYILRNIDPKLPTVIAGDFNSVRQSAGPRLLAEKGFRDAFAPAFTKPAETDLDNGPPTWQIDTGLGPIQSRIDYIFCSEGLFASKGRVIPETGSDHRLVVAVIGLPKGDASTQPATGAGP